MTITVWGTVLGRVPPPCLPVSIFEERQLSDQSNTHSENRTFKPEFSRHRAGAPCRRRPGGRRGRGPGARASEHDHESRLRPPGEGGREGGRGRERDQERESARESERERGRQTERGGEEGRERARARESITNSTSRACNSTRRACEFYYSSHGTERGLGNARDGQWPCCVSL